jgi:nicotinamidase-related amidase
VIHKRFNSSFEQTAREDELAKLGATHIALAGAATNWCVGAMACAALERGYDLTLIEDAHTTGRPALDDGARIAAANIVDGFNIAMYWLRHPDRTNGVAMAEAADFACPGDARS